MSQPLRRRSLPVRTGENKAGVRDEKRKPNKRSFKVYVGDYNGFHDPGNDPPLASRSSPPWLNSFYYVDPVWFAHGLDGETDMGGSYDLTGGCVSGDIAFMMPLEWATSAPGLSLFPALTTAEADPADDIIIVCCQRVNHTTGAVRIYWPISATPV